MEGTWLAMQCINPCHETLYPILEYVKEMAAAEQNSRIPSELLSRCPRCGGPMAVHIAAGPGFIEDTRARQRYRMFLERYHGKKLFVLELGIDWRNQLIKAPFMRLVEQEPYAAYVTVNLGEVYIFPQIRDKAMGVDGDHRSLPRNPQSAGHPGGAV